MKLGYLNSFLKTSLLTTLFGIGAFSANAAGHLPSTYQVEGKNHGRVIDSIITEIAPGLMRIENENAVVFTFSETREDFPMTARNSRPSRNQNQPYRPITKRALKSGVVNSSQSERHPSSKRFALANSARNCVWFLHSHGAHHPVLRRGS